MEPRDPERPSFAGRVRRMAGVLSVVDEHPGGVTVRTVAGHGDRIRRAALAIAPPDVELHVLEDDLVATVPQLPPSGPSPVGSPPASPGPAAAGTAPGDGARSDADLCCSSVFCRHRPDAAEFGLRAGDRCRQKIGVTNGWLSCPGHYRVEPPARRRWWGGIR